MKNYSMHVAKAAFLFLLLSGCGFSASNKDAQEIAGKFYDALKIGDAASAAALCGTDEVMTTKAWQDVLAQNLNSLGKVTSYEKGSGFDVSINNGETTVLLKYDVVYEFGKSRDSLKMVDNGDGFKIFKYNPELLEAKFKVEQANAEAIATKYMEFLAKGDYQTAMTYVGYAGLEKFKPEEWTDFYNLMNTQAGKIVDFHIDKEASISYLNIDDPNTGKGNVYSTLFIINRSLMQVTEQVLLFQPAFGQELKVFDHSVK